MSNDAFATTKGPLRRNRTQPGRATRQAFPPLSSFWPTTTINYVFQYSDCKKICFHKFFDQSKTKNCFSNVANTHPKSPRPHLNKHLYSFCRRLRHQRRLFAVYSRVGMLVECWSSKRPPTSLNWLWLRRGKHISKINTLSVQQAHKHAHFRWASFRTKRCTHSAYGTNNRERIAIITFP